MYNRLCVIVAHKFNHCVRIWLLHVFDLRQYAARGLCVVFNVTSYSCTQNARETNLFRYAPCPVCTYTCQTYDAMRSVLGAHVSILMWRFVMYIVHTDPITYDAKRCTHEVRIGSNLWPVPCSTHATMWLICDIMCRTQHDCGQLMALCSAHTWLTWDWRYAM